MTTNALVLSQAQQFDPVLVASPLDQFSNDMTFSVDLLNNLFIDYLPLAGLISYALEGLDFLGLSELSSISDWVVALVIGLSSVLVNISSSNESEWERGSFLGSKLQSVIFTLNVFGMLPGIETVTSEASVAFTLSFATLITVVVVGFTIHGIRFLSILYPTGTPTAIAPFIILIEFISYVARAVSLGMRLFANMFAGHSLVKIIMSFLWIFINTSLPILGIPVFVLMLVIFLLELGIAFLQAYVFATLSNMYLEDAVSLGH